MIPETRTNTALNLSALRDGTVYFIEQCNYVDWVSFYGWHDRESIGGDCTIAVFKVTPKTK